MQNNSELETALLRLEKISEETQKSIQKSNKQWGHIANKMGKLVEDIVLPGIKPVINEYFKCKIIKSYPNASSILNGQDYELDLLALSTDKAFLTEVKSTVRQSYIDDLVMKKLVDFHKFFPEYKHLKPIPVISSISIPESMVKYATKKNVYAMIWRNYDYLDIVNFNEVNIK